MNNDKKKSKLVLAFQTFLMSRAFLVTLLVLAVACAVWFGVSNPFHHEAKSTKLGFEDIGELATQEAITTEVSTMEADRELWGISIPFTQSKYIFSYDVSIKAGYRDFGNIHYNVNEEAKTISVTLPEPEVLTCELDTDSFQVYHESESVFRQITLDETNQAIGELQENAKNDAVANGLLDRARENAETILTAFFGQQYDMEEYTIQFGE